MAENKTSFDDTLKDVATKLEGLLDGNGIQAFHDLIDRHPNAGEFNRAQWVERMVDDRRNGVVAHAEHLKTTFTQMAAKLRELVDKFDSVDDKNSKDIKAVLDKAKTDAETEIKTWNTKTEQAQGNHATGAGKDDKSDGDGYNDNVNDWYDPGGADERKL